MRRNHSRIFFHQQEQLLLEITAPEEGTVTSETAITMVTRASYLPYFEKKKAAITGNF